MPIVPLGLNLDTPEDQIFGVCDDAGLKGKEANEVYHSLDAIRGWRQRFETLHGRLLGCDHHSNPDDPPDLTFRFRDKAVPVEHTRLQPSQYGWMDALHHKEYPKQCITVPPITCLPTGKSDLVASMFAMDAEWSDVQCDLNEWFRFCMALVRKKIEHKPGGILIIQDTSLVFDNQLRPIAEAAHAFLSPRPGRIKDWTIILHSRSNPIQFNSYLIAPAEELHHLNGH